MSFLPLNQSKITLHIYILYEGGVKHHDPNTKTFCLNNKSKVLFMPTQYICLSCNQYICCTNMLYEYNFALFVLDW